MSCETRRGMKDPMQLNNRSHDSYHMPVCRNLPQRRPKSKIAYAMRFRAAQSWDPVSNLSRKPENLGRLVRCSDGPAAGARDLHDFCDQVGVGRVVFAAIV